MDIFSENINILLTDTDKTSGIDFVWLVINEESGLLGILDGVCTSEEDAMFLAQDASINNVEARFWIQRVPLTGPALEIKS